jgi:inhibitor of cysteine peptidase
VCDGWSPCCAGGRCTHDYYLLGALSKTKALTDRASLHELGETEGLHMAEVVLTQTQSGICISAAPEDVIVIRLAEHPTTGYRWQVENATGLVLTGDDFTVSSSAPGTGGERVFRFAVQQSSTARIVLSLRRRWETGTTPAARFEVTVEIGRS